jgi:hypothetical protein
LALIITEHSLLKDFKRPSIGINRLQEITMKGLMPKDSVSFLTIFGCGGYNDVINIDWCKTCSVSVNINAVSKKGAES